MKEAKSSPCCCTSKKRQHLPTTIESGGTALCDYNNGRRTGEVPAPEIMIAVTEALDKTTIATFTIEHIGGVALTDYTR